MLAIVVRLEQRDPQIQLEHDTTYRPHIAWLCPPQLEDYLRSSVVTSRYNCAVMLVVKCCAAKIDESNVCAFDATDFPVLKKNEHNESP